MNLEKIQSLGEELFNDSMTKKSLRFDVFILFLIFVTSLIFVLETSTINPLILKIFFYVELIILIIFSFELIFRFIAAPSKKKFFLSIYTWIDIIAIVPFWFGVQSQFIRMFRLFRVFRFLRFLVFSNKYIKSHKFQDFTLEKIFMFRIIFTVFMVLFVASALIFQLEYQYNPSISTFWDAFYFMAVSITTVGYGDITPMRDISKLLVISTIVCALVIVPVHITSMIKYLAEEKTYKHKECTKCGVSLHQKDAKYCRHCGVKL